MFAPPLSAKTETKPTNDEITPSEENTDKPAHSSNEAPSKEVIHLAIVQKILKFRPFSAEYPQHGAYHHKDKELQIKKAVFLFNTSSVHLGSSLTRPNEVACILAEFIYIYISELTYRSVGAYCFISKHPHGNDIPAAGTVLSIDGTTAVARGSPWPSLCSFTSRHVHEPLCLWGNIY